MVLFYEQVCEPNRKKTVPPIGNKKGKQSKTIRCFLFKINRVLNERTWEKYNFKVFLMQQRKLEEGWTWNWNLYSSVILYIFYA